MVNWPYHHIPEGENGYKTLDIIIYKIQDFRANFPSSPILTHCRVKIMNEIIYFLVPELVEQEL
jgi:hypothetical protein